MKFVFADPPSPKGFVAFRHSHGGYGENCRTSRLKFPALDIFHSASLLLERGVEACIVDSVLEDHTREEFVRTVKRQRPKIVAMRTSSGSSPDDLQAASALKAALDVPVVFFGSQAAVEGDSLLANSAVDAVVTGEPPAIFAEIARRRGFSGVRGVWYKHAGRVVKNAPAELSSELDFLPVPRWDLVDFRRYSYVTSQTSWGCPFRCGYCPYPVTQGERWRTRSISRVVEEFQALRERYGLRFVLLRDPEFSLERRRTIELCRALIAAGTPLLWGCETRLDTLDEPLIALMAKAGCIRVAFGVDSVHAPTLAAMGRRFAGESAVREKVAALKRHGVLTYAMYIVGLPGETRASTQRMIDFALELDTEAASFSMATPFPGTTLERLGRERGFIVKKDPSHLTGCVPSMRNESMTLSEVESLYLSAKESWKRSKAAKEGPKHSFALSNPA